MMFAPEEGLRVSKLVRLANFEPIGIDGGWSQGANLLHL